MFLRSNQKKKQEISLQEPIGVDKEGNEITLMEVIAGDDTILDTVELNLLQEKMAEMIDGLKAREKKVILMRFGLGMGKRHTQKQIAAQLGISRSYVSRIEKRIIQKLNRPSTSNKQASGIRDSSSPLTLTLSRQEGEDL